MAKILGEKGLVANLGIQAGSVSAKSGAIQSIVAQDPYQMGYQGVGYIDKARKNMAIDKKENRTAAGANYTGEL